MKKIVGICLAVMMMVFASSIVIAEDSTDEYGIWNIDEFVDEFDMPNTLLFLTLCMENSAIVLLQTLRLRHISFARIILMSKNRL